MKKTGLITACLTMLSVAIFSQSPQHIEKPNLKETEAKKAHPGNSGNHQHNNGANAHGMEMKEKQHVKQKEKKEEHAEKKAKQAAEKKEKND